MKGKIKNILGIVFFIVMTIFMLAALLYHDDTDMDEYRHIQQQIREEKLIQGGW